MDHLVLLWEVPELCFIIHLSTTEMPCEQSHNLGGHVEEHPTSHNNVYLSGNKEINKLFCASVFSSIKGMLIACSSEGHDRSHSVSDNLYVPVVNKGNLFQQKLREHCLGTLCAGVCLLILCSYLFILVFIFCVKLCHWELREM